LRNRADIPPVPRAIPESSINRAVIGNACPLIEYRDRGGRDLLASRALETLRQRASAGEADFTREFARRLAALLHSLFTGDVVWPPPPADSAAALEAIRQYWISCPRVILGGGYLSGEPGREIVADARLHLEGWGLGDRNITLFDRPGSMPLYGASTGQPAVTLVIDFGHTSAKGAILQESGELEFLKPRPMGINAAHEGWDPDYARTVHGAIRKALAGFRDECRDNAAVPAIAISLAAYLENGVLVDNHRGGYCKLRMINPDFNDLIGDIWEDLGMPRPQVCSWHDGSAAARNLSGPGAALVFGTAVGHGFSPVI
jgi:hypothetical protein